MRPVSVLSLAALLLLGAAPLAAQARSEHRTITSTILGNTRTLRIVLPPGYDSTAAAGTRYPVLYLHDGQWALAGASDRPGATMRADSVALSLMRRGRIPPMILVAIDNMGRQRSYEYVPYHDPGMRVSTPDPGGSRYVDFVVEEVIPFVEGHYRAAPGAEHRGLGGASFGGLITLYAAATRPGVFSRFLVESASVFVDDRHVLRDVAAAAWKDERIFLGMGTNEGGRPGCTVDGPENDMVTNIRDAAMALQDAGLPARQVRLEVEHCATHDPGAWARRLPTALLFLYGS